jgi:hypothetical protein
MSLPLSQQFASLGIEEVIPQMARAPTVTSASVIQQRRRKRITTQGPQTVTSASPQQIIFNLSDATDYLDLQSVVLCGSYQTTSASPGGADFRILDDGIVALFSRVRVSVNSQEVSSVGGPGFGAKCAAEIYSSCTDSWYNGAGLNAGFTKYNNRNFSSDNVTDLASAITGVLSARKNEPSARGRLVQAYQSAGTTWCIPMSILVPFFRQETLFPLRNCGTVQITIDLAPVNEAFFCSDNVAPTWTLSNLDLWYDTCAMHPTYVSVMDSLMRDPNEAGLTLPYTEQQVMSSQYASGSGQKSIQLPRSAKNVRQIQFVSRPTSNITALNGPKTAFSPNGYVEALVQVGSQRYPDSFVTGFGRSYMELLYSNNLLANPLGGVIADIENYSGLSFGGGAVDSLSPCFIWSQNLDKVRTEFIALDGVDSSANGGQIVVMLTNDVSVSHTLTAFIEQTQFLKIHGSKIEVV